jgi:hypothetical protein
MPGTALMGLDCGDMIFPSVDVTVTVYLWPLVSPAMSQLVAAVVHERFDDPSEAV